MCTTLKNDLLHQVKNNKCMHVYCWIGRIKKIHALQMIKVNSKLAENLHKFEKCFAACG